MNTTFDIQGLNPINQDTLDKLNIIVLESEGNRRKILLDQVVYHVLIKEFNYENKTAIINVDGFNFSLKMNEPLDRLIAQLGFLKANKQSVKDIKSPMPGLVVKVFIEVGQTVNEGDKLLTLEAMKMENILKSTGSGVVKNILVSSGDTVEKNSLLVELE